MIDSGVPIGSRLAVLRRTEEGAELRLLHARAGPEPAAPLLQHDAAFLIDLLRVERDAAGKIAERVEAALQDAGPIDRHLQHVDGFVEAGLRIHVRTEPRAGRFQIRNQLTGLEARRPIERHVLEHVREAALIVGFVHRAGANDETQEGALLGTRVGTDEVDQAVGQRPGADRRRQRQRRIVVLRLDRRGESEQQQDRRHGTSGQRAGPVPDRTAAVC